MKTIRLSIFLFLFAFCFQAKTQTVTRKVPSQYATIQAAIKAAVNGDTVLVAPGVYKGEGNRNIELLGKKIKVISEEGADKTIIDLEESDFDGFYIHQSEDTLSLVQGFRIINCGFSYAAINIDGASPTVRECKLENCRGLGLDIESSSAIIERTIIRKNGSRDGINCCYAAGTKIRNCLIAENRGVGAYILCGDSPLFINCTIANNRDAFYVSGYSIKLTMRNCIVWGNKAERGPTISGGLNLDISYSSLEGMAWPQMGNLSEDPVFLDTLYRLSPNSPCIDAGSPLDGLEPDGTQVNMGWYGNTKGAEAGNANAPIITGVSPTSGPPGGGTLVTISGKKFGSSKGSIKIGGLNVAVNSWSDTQIRFNAPAHAPGWVSIEVIKSQSNRSKLTFSYRYTGKAALKVPSQYMTIQEAIYIAGDGDTVLVAPGVYKGKGNHNIRLLGKKIKVISEKGPGVTIIDAEGIGYYGFYVHDNEDSSSVIQGFRIINCSFGGNAIYLDASSVTIRECVLENNGYTGLRMSYSYSIIEGTIIRNNRSSGIEFRYSPGAIIRNSMVVGNSTFYFGYAIKIEAGDSPLFLNCTIAYNLGGGLHSSSNNKLILRNCIVWGNDSKNSPNISAATTNITYSLIQGGWSGMGNLNKDPLFVAALKGDFHLAPVSPAIDAGDPKDDFSREPLPNGGRINMGCYGNTGEATSYPTGAYIRDFSYDLGCEENRKISISGLNFGSQRGNGRVTVGKNPIGVFSYWSDTLVQFIVQASWIEGNSIILTTNAGSSDTIPGSEVYTPYATFVSGEVSGVWTAQCPSTYILTDSIVIPDGKTLTIEPGVTVLVHNQKAGIDAAIVVHGTLQAIGRKESPIVFSLLPGQAIPGGWEGMSLDMKSSAGKTTLRNCIIEYAKNGVTVSDSDVSIDSCEIRNHAQNGVLFKVYNETVSGSVKNSHVHNNLGYGLGFDTYCSGTSAYTEATIANNLIENNQQGGLLIEASAYPPYSGYSPRRASAYPRIINNTIRSNKGFGIQCPADGNWADAIPFDFFYSAYASPRLEGNLIYDNEKGGFSTLTYYSGGGHWLSYSEPEIVNCTFVQNGGVGILAGDSSKVSVVNTIVTGTAPSGQEKGGGILKASHSTFLPSFPGTKMVDQAPLFQDQMAGDFHLMPGSPQIDAGDNTEANETKDLAGKTRIVDGNKDGKAVVDIGALEYQVAITPVNSVALPNPIRVFPNPAQEEVFVEYSGASVRLHIQLFDLSGRRLNDFGIRELGSGQSQKLLLGRLPSGTYFLEFKGEGYRFAYKVVAGR